MHRALSGAAFLLALGFKTSAMAQTAAEGQVVELSFETRDLVFETRDLVLTVEDLGGKVAELDGGTEGLQVTETDTEIRIELSGDVLFDFDSAEIREEAEPVLRGVADVLNGFPQASVVIAGYTDARGSDDYNLELSQRRADSVRAWLVQHGNVEGARVETKGFGEAEPVAANENPDGTDNPEGRQRNRRVEIAVQK